MTDETDDYLADLEGDEIPEGGLEIKDLTVHTAYALGGNELVLNVVFVRLLMALGYTEEDIRQEGNYDLEDVLTNSISAIRQNTLLSGLTSTH